MNEFSTAGVTFKYAVEATAGTRPTTGYTIIPNVKSTPDFNPEPSTLDVTDLSDKVWKRSIEGLKDIGGSLTFGANLTPELKTAWETCVADYATAKVDGKAVWFEVAIPNFDSFYFAGKPAELGLKAMEVDAVAEIDLFVTPNEVLGFATAST